METLDMISRTSRGHARLPQYRRYARLHDGHPRRDGCRARDVVSQDTATRIGNRPQARCGRLPGQVTARFDTRSSAACRSSSINCSSNVGAAFSSGSSHGGDSASGRFSSCGTSNRGPLRNGLGDDRYVRQLPPPVRRGDVVGDPEILRRIPEQVSVGYIIHEQQQADGDGHPPQGSKQKAENHAGIPTSITSPIFCCGP